jgi:hypothetical protein
MSNNYGPRIVTDGLVLCLDAADLNSYPKSGTSWYDLSGRNKIGSFNSYVDFDNNNNGSIVFNGSSARHTIGSLGLSGFTQLTVNIWYYSNVDSSTALIRSLDGVNSFILHYRGAGFYLTADNSAVSGYLGWQSTIPYNQWVMLTGTWNGSTMKLYQNSIKQNNELSFSGGVTNMLRSINLIELGYYFNTSQPTTNGKISQALIYNKALTNSEIRQNFEATKGRFGL